jgi:hypothetical protein
MLRPLDRRSGEVIRRVNGIGNTSMVDGGIGKLDPKAVTAFVLGIDALNLSCHISGPLPTGPLGHANDFVGRITKNWHKCLHIPQIARAT